MSRKLIATDLDGTILPDILTLSPRAADALREAARQGHIVVIATARPPSMTDWVYDAIGLDTPQVLLNGAYVYNPKDASYPVQEQLIHMADMQSLMHALAQSAGLVNGIMQYRDQFWCTIMPAKGYFAEVARQCDTRLLDPLQPPAMDCSRILAHVSDPQAAEAIFEKFPHLLIHRFPDKPGAEVARYAIRQPAADKWTGVWQVAQDFGIAREDIYTFGDEWNDEGMLRGAGHGYALLGSPMAAEMPLSTPATCEEDGVALVIEREILR